MNRKAMEMGLKIITFNDSLSRLDFYGQILSMHMKMFMCLLDKQMNVSLGIFSFWI